MNWDEFEWGGSGIEEVVFGFILGKFNPGQTIVELGAGHISTAALSEVYNLFSVEHDREFIGHYNSHYIHAPIKNGWYDIDVLNGLPDNPSLVIIDGVNRRGILDHLDIFGPRVKYLIHDTYREKERQLAYDLAEKVGRPVEFYSNADHWAFI